MMPGIRPRLVRRTSLRLAVLTLPVLLTPFTWRVAEAAVLSCTVSATSVLFGTYTPMQPSALVGTGVVTAVCDVNSHKNAIAVDLSAGSSGSFTNRTMTTTVGTTTYALNYNLYLDAADTQIWGDGTGGSLVNNVTLTRHGNNNTITTNLTVYGSVARAQDPSPGTYTDSIIVTVNF